MAAAVTTDRIRGVSASLAVKAPCKVASTAALTMVGEQTVSGVAVVDGDRVLQAIPGGNIYNGIWTVKGGGLEWERAADFDGNRDFVKGTMVIVAPGASAQIWQLVTTNPQIGSALEFTILNADALAVLALKAQLADPTSAANGTGLLGWLRALTGAVASTLYAWLQRQEVDAEEFGAVGNGTTNDQAAIQLALNSGAKIVHLRSKNYKINTGLTMPAGVQLIGEGQANTTITLGANITPFNVTNVNDTNVEGLLVVVNAAQTAPIWLVTASTVTVTRNLFQRVQISSAPLSFEVVKFTAGGAFGVWNNHADVISVSGAGTLVKLGTTAVGSWVRSNTFTRFYANDFLIGFDVLNAAGDGAGENDVRDWGAQTSARTTFCVRIPNSVVAENQQNTFHNAAFYDLQGAAVQYFIGTGVRDTSITGATGDPLTPARFTDNGLRTRLTMVAQYLTQLLASGRYQPIPTNATWANTGNTGTATTTQATSYLQLRTGVTNPSTAFGFTEVFGGMCSTSVLAVDFGKKFILGFGLSRATSNAAVVGRVQIKNSSAAGSLGAAGLGILINDLAMTGESYGSALGGVSIGNLVDGASSQIMIIHYPGVRTEWWVNGVYVAQQTDVTKIPSGTVGVRLIGILGNNSVADAQMFISQPWMWADIT